MSQTAYRKSLGDETLTGERKRKKKKEKKILSLGAIVTTN